MDDVLCGSIWLILVRAFWEYFMFLAIAKVGKFADSTHTGQPSVTPSRYRAHPSYAPPWRSSCPVVGDYPSRRGFQTATSTVQRASQKEQADNFSLRSQDDDCTDYCKQVSLYAPITFTDVGSGISVKQRPQFVQMCRYALNKNNGVTDVVFNDLDRFSRNIRQFFEFTDPLMNTGVNLHLASEG